VGLKRPDDDQPARIRGQSKLATDRGVGRGVGNIGNSGP